MLYHKHPAIAEQCNQQQPMTQYERVDALRDTHKIEESSVVALTQLNKSDHLHLPVLGL